MVALFFIVILYGETVMLLGFICFCILKEFFFLNEQMSDKRTEMN